MAFSSRSSCRSGSDTDCTCCNDVVGLCVERSRELLLASHVVMTQCLKSGRNASSLHDGHFQLLRREQQAHKQTDESLCILAGSRQFSVMSFPRAAFEAPVPSVVRWVLPPSAVVKQRCNCYRRPICMPSCCEPQTDVVATCNRTLRSPKIWSGCSCGHVGCALSAVDVGTTQVNPAWYIASISIHLPAGCSVPP